MKHLPQISEAEWEVMTVLWEGSPLTAQSIIRKLEGKCSWKPKTVKSLISRLLNKKVIGFEAMDRSYAYHPLISRDEYIIEESRTFLDRVYNGSFSSMVSTLVHSSSLNKNDVEALRKILDDSGRKG